MRRVGGGQRRPKVGRVGLRGVDFKRIQKITTKRSLPSYPKPRTKGLFLRTTTDKRLDVYDQDTTEILPFVDTTKVTDFTQLGKGQGRHVCHTRIRSPFRRRNQVDGTCLCTKIPVHPGLSGP